MTQSNNLRKFLTCTGAAAMLAGGSLVAGDYGKAIIDDKVPIEPWTFCDIFDMSTLYESDSGFIREIALNGRYHGQQISQSEEIDGTLKNGYHNWQHRRFRLGMDIAFAGDVTLKTSANISNGSGSGHGLTRGPFFDNWDEFYLDWEPDGAGLKYIQVGKQKQHITREYTESSKRILTVERAPITNEVADQKPWGIAVGFEAFGLEHEIGGWITGAYAAGFGEWGNYEQSRGSATYRVSAPITDATELFFDYAYVNNSSGDVSSGGSHVAVDFAANYEHTIAIGTESEWGRLGLVTDLIFAANREFEGDSGWAGEADIASGNDTWGLVIMPYYDITEKLQFVFRYAYMQSGEQQRTQRFSEVAGDDNYDFYRLNVENYHTIYTGLNYYICDHNLKVMFGHEYATGDLYGAPGDVDSSTWMAAIRTYF